MVRGNFPWVGVVCIQGFARTRTQIHIREWRGYGADRAVLFGSLELIRRRDGGDGTNKTYSYMFMGWKSRPSPKDLGIRGVHFNPQGARIAAHARASCTSHAT